MSNAILVVFPTACRVAGLSVRSGVRRAVWPAVWPMIPTGLLVFAARPFVAPELPSILAVCAAAELSYLAVFVTFALPREERRWYVEKALSSISRQPAVTA